MLFEEAQTMQISTASQNELESLFVTPIYKIVPSLDLSTLPMGTIVRLKTQQHSKYLLQVDEFRGKRAVHVVLSDKTGTVGSVKYRGLYPVRPEYMVLEIGKQFKYELILTPVLAEIGLSV